MARTAATIAVFLASAAGLAADELHVSLVPWQLVEAGESVDAPLILYWIPGSPEELRRSELLTSRELTLFSSRCVAMRVVRLDDESRLEKLGVDGELPAVVLADRSCQVVGRVEGEEGAVSIAEVEELVREELDRRAAEAEALLDRARERAEDHDTAAAITIYESVWEARCVCPRQGRHAKRALKKLARK
ncbi:MAG TPA: hypothetical protein VEK57_20830 [Thermoanaerobaculia bacterium]|nr:hypothetical protein [Thermoanaerobaculia bacterium]